MKLKQYFELLKVGIRNLKKIDNDVPDYVVRHASEKFFDYIKTPHLKIGIEEPPYDEEWHKEWHEHICLPLLIGGTKMYECFCPYAQNEDFEKVYGWKCDYCENFVIIDSPRDHFLRVLQDDFEKTND